MKLIMILIALRNVLLNLSSNPNMGEAHHKYMAWLIETMLDLQGQKGRLINLKIAAEKKAEKHKLEIENLKQELQVSRNFNKKLMEEANDIQEELQEVYLDNQTLRHTISLVNERLSELKREDLLEQVEEEV